MWSKGVGPFDQMPGGEGAEMTESAVLGRSATGSLVDESAVPAGLARFEIVDAPLGGHYPVGVMLVGKGDSSHPHGRPERRPRMEDRLRTGLQT